MATAEGAVRKFSNGKHIELNVGNVFAVGFLSLLWWGVATWASAYLAQTNIPGVAPLAVGAQTYLHAA